jgi:hypothetical protein
MKRKKHIHNYFSKDGAMVSNCNVCGKDGVDEHNESLNRKKIEKLVLRNGLIDEYAWSEDFNEAVVKINEIIDTLNAKEDEPLTMQDIKNKINSSLKQ